MNQGYEPKQDKPGTEYIPPNRGSGEVNKEQLPVCIHYKNGKCHDLYQYGTIDICDNCKR